jgi:hypothetical protein
MFMGATTVRLLPGANVMLLKFVVPPPMISSEVVLLVNTTVDVPPSNVPLLFQPAPNVCVNDDACNIAPALTKISPANDQAVGVVIPDAFEFVISIASKLLAAPASVICPVPANTTFPVELKFAPRSMLTFVVGENVMVPELVTDPEFEKLPSIV